MNRELFGKGGWIFVDLDRLEHVPEKLYDFSALSDIGYIRCLSDETMRQLIDLEWFPLDRASPPDRKTL